MYPKESRAGAGQLTALPSNAFVVMRTITVMLMTARHCAAATGLISFILASGCATSGKSREPPTVQGSAPVPSVEQTCPVHGDRLQRENVRVVYGYVPREFSSEYREAKRDLFPYADMYCWGGCDEGDADPLFKQVLYCPECRKAYEAWLKTHVPLPDGMRSAATK